MNELRREDTLMNKDRNAKCRDTEQLNFRNTVNMNTVPGNVKGDTEHKNTETLYLELQKKSITIIMMHRSKYSNQSIQRSLITKEAK